MTPPASGRSARRTRRAALAAALLLSSLAACSSGSGGAGGGPNRGDGGRPGDRSENELPGTDANAPSRPSNPGKAAPADPTVTDVPDRTLPGLGDPRIDVSHYDVQVTADPRKAPISGRVTLTLQARTARPLPSFTLDLKGPTVRTATVDGAPAEVTAGDDEITVTPTAALAPGRDATVVLTYAGRPGTSEFAGLSTDVGWRQDDDGGWFTMSEPDGTRTWVPVNDHPSDKATWTVTLDTPAAVTGVSNGRLQSSKRTGDRRHWVWVTDRPMASYLVLVAIGDYRLIQRDGPSGTRIVLAVPRSASDEDVAGFDPIDDMIEYFTATFGPYPDDDLGAVWVPATLGVALETQTRPLFGNDAVDDGTVYALGHELAHQWWGNALTPERWQDLWLNEGFATYSEWMYEAEVDGESLDNRVAAERHRIDAPVTDPDAAGDFGDNVYDGGAFALHALRKELGDRAFLAVLRAYYRAHRNGSVTTDDFVTTAQEVSGKNLTTWRQAWLDTAPQPRPR